LTKKLLDSAGHRAMARKLANEAMVLLRMTGCFRSRLWNQDSVVGPLADQTNVLLG